MAAALVGTAWPHLRTAGRTAAALCLALVCLARLAVGAHLPLDVVAGASLGVAVALLVRLLPLVQERSLR